MKKRLNDVLRPLGLKKPEVLVYYKLLAYDHANVSVLARETKIPRTSLYTILTTLQKRALARQITVGGHKEWQAASPEELQIMVERSHEAVEDVLPELIKRQGYKSLVKKGSVEFVAEEKTKSRAALRTLYGNLRQLPKGSRVYFIEGTDSQKYKYGRYGTAYKKSWQNLLTDASFSFHGIISKTSLEHLCAFEESVLRLFWKNPISLTVVDDDLLDFDCDIIITKDQVFFAHPPHNTAAVINYAHTAQAMISLYKNLEITGTKVDLQEELQKRI